MLPITLTNNQVFVDGEAATGDRCTENTAVPPNPWRILSKTPSGYLKWWILSNPMYTVDPWET